MLISSMWWTVFWCRLKLLSHFPVSAPCCKWHVDLFWAFLCCCFWSPPWPSPGRSRWVCENLLTVLTAFSSQSSNNFSVSIIITLWCLTLRNLYSAWLYTIFWVFLGSIDKASSAALSSEDFTRDMPVLLAYILIASADLEGNAM